MVRTITKRMIALLLTFAMTAGMLTYFYTRPADAVEIANYVDTYGTTLTQDESDTNIKYLTITSYDEAGNATSNTTYTGVYMDNNGYYYYVHNGVINYSLTYLQEIEDNYYVVYKGKICEENYMSATNSRTLEQGGLFYTDTYESYEEAYDNYTNGTSYTTYMYYIGTDCTVDFTYTGPAQNCSGSNNYYYMIVEGKYINLPGMLEVDGVRYMANGSSSSRLYETEGFYNITTYTSDGTTYNYEYYIWNDDTGSFESKGELTSYFSDCLSSDSKIYMYADGDMTIDYTGVKMNSSNSVYYYIAEGIVQFQYSGYVISEGKAYSVSDGIATLVTSETIIIDEIGYEVDEGGNAATVPADSVMAKATVANVEEGATVTAYKIIEGVYNDYGLTDYALVSILTEAGLSIADFEAPTGEEVNAIADAIESGTVTGLESVVMTEDDTFEGTETLYYSLDSSGSTITYNDKSVYYATNDDGETYYLYYDNNAAGYVIITEDEAEELGIATQADTTTKSSYTVDDVAIVTYTAYLSAGTWLVLVTGLSSDTVYNPMIVSVQYENASVVTSIYAGWVSADGTYMFDTIYAKSATTTIDKIISYTSCAYANDYGTIENIGDSVEFTITVSIPQYSTSYKSATLVFTITDNLSDGFEDLSADDFTVYVDDTEVSASSDTYAVSVTVNDDGSQTTTITFASDYIYDHAGSDVEVIYSAILAADAAVATDEDDNSNMATITYTNTYDTTFTEESNPVYVYTFALTKEVQKVRSEEAFSGSETLYYPVSSDGEYITYNDKSVYYATNDDGETYYLYYDNNAAGYVIITEDEAEELGIATQAQADMTVDDIGVEDDALSGTETLYYSVDSSGSYITYNDNYVYYAVNSDGETFYIYYDSDAGGYVTAAEDEAEELGIATQAQADMTVDDVTDDTTVENYPVSGSTFTIYTDEDCTEVYTNTVTENGTAVTESDGYVVFSGIEAGTYYITETNAANITDNEDGTYSAGYFINPNIYKVTITATLNNDGTLNYYSVIINNISNTDEGDDVRSKYTITYSTDGTKSVSSSVTTTMVKNSLLLILASTGGIGICFLIGLSVMVFACVIVFTRKRKKKAAV